MEYSDKNGLRWHLLSSITIGGEMTEVMAATCIDGIGAIVRWEKNDEHWTAEVLDTEGCEWQTLVVTDEGNEIPSEPPEVWDDVSSPNSVLNEPSAAKPAMKANP